MPSSSGVIAKILLDEGWGETIKAGSHRRVGGKQVARAGHGQRDVERLACLLHETAGAFEHGERRMPFIQMTYFRSEAERGQQSPAADAEQQFLLQAQFGSAAIQFAGDSAMRRKVRRVIAVQQVQLDSSDLDLPGAQPDRVTRQGDFQAQPLAVLPGAKG